MLSDRAEPALSGFKENTPAEGPEVSEAVPEVMGEEDEARTPPLAPHCGTAEASSGSRGSWHGSADRRGGAAAAAAAAEGLRRPVPGKDTFRLA